MTALRREAIQLMEQMPEEQMPNIIRYMHTLKGKTFSPERRFVEEDTTTPEMRAFSELEQMLVPVSQELDYDRELEQARDERYGHID